MCMRVERNQEKKIKQLEDSLIKNVRNLFVLRKGNKAIKDSIIGYIRNLFEQEEDYFKPLRVNKFWNNNYIEYESNGDRNKNLTIKEYLEEIKPYLKGIINDLQKFDTWKIPLTIAINFISSISFLLYFFSCNAFKKL